MLLFLSARTLSPAGVNLGGVYSFHPTSAKGHDELEGKAKPGKVSSHDGSFTSNLTDHRAANGFKRAFISLSSHQQRSHTHGGKHTLSAKRVLLLNYESGDTIDTSWARVETTVVEVRSAPEHPPLVTTTSRFPICGNVLYLLRVHHEMCYNQYNWDGLECNHMLPPYVVQDHCTVKPKSIPTTLCNVTAPWNDVRGKCPP